MARATISSGGQVFGRARELAVLETVLAGVASGRGGTVLLEGEPGIGKTRLAEEALARAPAGVRTAWGRCVRDSGAPPLWPWRPAFRAAGVDLEELLRAVGGVADERRFATLELMAAALAHAARDAALLVVLDDVHWADEASALLLHRVAQDAADLPVLLIATFRSSEPGSVAPVLADLARARGTQRLLVVGLDEAAVGEQLHALTGEVPDPAVRAEVARATGGNPFFVGELARAAQDGVGLGTVPAAVRDVVAQRVAALPPPAAAVLIALAVLGDRAPDDLVTSLAEVGAAEGAGHLVLLTRAGLLHPDGPGRHRFAHALVRDAVREGLPPGALVALHGRAATLLVAGTAVADTVAAEVASHLSQAGPEHCGQAAAWCGTAGQQALRDLAYADAARWFRRGLDVGGHALAPLTAGSLHLGAARAAYLSGDLDQAALSCLSCARAARAAGDVVLLAEAALVLEAVDVPGHSAALRDLCCEALDAVGDDGQRAALRARLVAHSCHLAFSRGDSSRLQADSATALRLAEQADDDQALVAALRARQSARCHPGAHEEVRALGDRMIAAGERLRSPTARMWGHLWRVDALVGAGALRQLDEEVERLAEEVAQVRGPIAAWHLGRCRALAAQARGRILPALAAAEQAWRQMNTVDEVAASRQLLALAGAVARHATVPADTAALAAGTGGDLERFPFSVVHRAATLLDTDRVAEAEALYRSLGPPDEWAAPPFLRLPLLATGLRLAAAVGRTADVTELMAALAPFRGGHVASAAGAAVYLGPVELTLGEAAAAHGDLRAAEEDLRRAADVADRSGAAGFATEARCRLAEVLEAAGDRSGEAAELRTTAGREAEALGLDRLLARARAGAREEPPRPAAAASPLSPREDEVAGLVAEGLTNKQIAGRLYLSERTAANHVQHILTKLGFARRSEIASWVVRRG